MRDNGIEPTVVQYLKTPPTRAELVKMIKDAGIDVRTAVRKRESLYGELKLADASDDALLDAMAEHPILIERPFVVTPEGHPAGPPARRGTRDSVRVRHPVVAAAALAVLVITGCAPEAPDYQSILSTTPTTTTTTTSPGSEPPLPIATYLEQKGVVGEPIPADKLTDLKVTYPTPPGWKPFVNSNLSPGTRVIAKGTTYPMAMVIVFKLNGDFDVNEAIGHGYVDAEMSENFKRLNASMDNFKGFPSSMIEGSYDLNGSRMHTYNRIVIATGAPPANQRYLIQFSVTGYADKAAEEAPDMEAIIKGFDVAVPKAPPPR